MATEMHPDKESEVFGTAIDAETLREFETSSVLTILREGRIGGLNGVLLGAAAERGLHGGCLLGEMPHLLIQLPYPNASLAVLRAFCAIADVDVDLSGLEEQAETSRRQLSQLLQQSLRESGEDASEEEGFGEEPAEESRLPPEDERQIERLFSQARQGARKPMRLKRLLDRLEVFPDYEDRFLDLFKKGGTG